MLGGIKAVCAGVLLYFIADVYVMTWFTARVLPRVTFASEMKSMLSILAYAAVMGTGVYLLDNMICSDAVSLGVGIIVGLMLYMAVTLLAGSQEARYLLGIMRKRR